MNEGREYRIGPSDLSQEIWPFSVPVSRMETNDRRLIQSQINTFPGLLVLQTGMVSSETSLQDTSQVVLVLRRYCGPRLFVVPPHPHKNMHCRGLKGMDIETNNAYNILDKDDTLWFLLNLVVLTKYIHECL